MRGCSLWIHQRSKIGELTVVVAAAAVGVVVAVVAAVAVAELIAVKVLNY